MTNTIVAMVELEMKVNENPLAGPEFAVALDDPGLAAEAAATAFALALFDGALILIVRRRGKNGTRNIWEGIHTN